MERVSDAKRQEMEYLQMVNEILIERSKHKSAFIDAEGLATLMDDWVQQYVTPDDSADWKTRAEYPLRAAKIEVRDVGAGSYQIVMHLQPHFQIDDVAAAVVLRTKVTRPGAA